MRNWSTLFLILFSLQWAPAQYQIGLVPRVSPDKGVSQKIGYTEVEVKYGSPSLRNRMVWGELVPYDKVWRAGANNATTVRFSAPVRINNETLDSGTYAIFIIPRNEDKWTVIFNSEFEQWGAFNYDETKDALRHEIVPRKSAMREEDLSYSITQLGFEFGSIVMSWGNIVLEIPFETDYLDQFKKEVEKRAEKQPEHISWVVYTQGADHLEQRNLNNDLALEWLEKAEVMVNSNTEWNKQFYPRDYIKGHLYWVKAKALAKSGHISEAMVYGEKVKTMEKNMFYKRLNEEEGIDELLSAWKEK